MRLLRSWASFASFSSILSGVNGEPFASDDEGFQPLTRAVVWPGVDLRDVFKQRGGQDAVVASLPPVVLTRGGEACLRGSVMIVSDRSLWRATESSSLAESC